jgi:hypothetical protein
MQDMKKLCALLLLSLLSQYSIGQQWALFNSWESCHYQSDTALFFDYRISVIDKQVVGSDTAFTLNPKVRYCDSCCEGHRYGAFPNEAGFFGKYMQSPAPGIYICYDPDTLIFHSQAALGDSWIIKPQDGISARVQAIYQDTIIEELDSMKLLLLSNGDTIVLSKNHGLVRFKDPTYHHSYRLVGLPQRGLGQNDPSVQEIFNFQVGDVFHYVESNGGPGGYANTYIKREVLSKQSFPDSVAYQIHENSSREYLGHLERLIDSTYFFGYKFSTSLLQKYLLGNFIALAYGGYAEVHHAYNSTFSVNTLTAGSRNDAPPYMTYVANGDSSCYHDTIFLNPLALMTSYAASYGLMSNYEEFGDNIYDFYLEGISRAGINTGVIRPDGFYLGWNEVAEASNLALAREGNLLKILHLLASTPYKFDFTDMNGREVFPDNLSNGVFNLDKLGAGVYALRVRSPNGAGKTFKVLR